MTAATLAARLGVGTTVPYKDRRRSSLGLRRRSEARRKQSRL